MRSYSPSTRSLNKDVKSNLLKDRIATLKTEKDLDNELVILQKQLQEIRGAAMENEKSDQVAEKLKKILDYANQALNSRLFLSIKEKSKGRFKTQTGEDEDTKENHWEGGDGEEVVERDVCKELGGFCEGEGFLWNVDCM